MFQKRFYQTLKGLKGASDENPKLTFEDGREGRPAGLENRRGGVKTGGTHLHQPLV